MFNCSFKDLRKCKASKVMDAAATDLEVWNLIGSTLTNSDSIKIAYLSVELSAVTPAF
jgi:hypothetical protein